MDNGIQKNGKTDIMFFLDAEDYTTPRSDDAVRELADLFAEEGVVANFDVVGFYAQKLIENRRYDILESLHRHTVGSQSLYHSLHPTDCELAGAEDAREAYRLFLDREATSVGMLRAAFGLDRILYLSSPGNSFPYIAGNVEYDIGGVAALAAVPGSAYGMWYANLLQLPYTWDIETMFPPNPEPDYGALLDGWAETPWQGLAMHPDKVRSTIFWDAVNYPRENLVPWREWNVAPRRDEADVQEFYRRLRRLCRALVADSRFRVTDVHSCISELRPRRPIERGDLPAIEASLRADFGPVREPGSYCVADVFQAAVRFLRGDERACAPGKALGFVERPVGVAAPVKVRSADLRAAAAGIDLGWYLPPSIPVGGVALGPADFLFAALEALRTDAAEVEVLPKEQLGSFDRLPGLEKFSYMAGWPIHAPDLPDQRLSDRLRWQLWTLRYE